MIRIAFETLGCKVNQAETNVYVEQARRLGWQVVDYSDAADVYIVNTCTVTNEADRQSAQIARRGPRRNPGALMVVTGCAAGNRASTTHWHSLEEQNTLFVPNAVKEDLLAAVQSRLQQENPARPTSDVRRPTSQPIPWDLPPPETASNTRGFLKITDGCNHACAYCIIPQMRGGVRSVPPDEVVRRVRRAVAKGYKELVLTGIHLGSYGRDLHTNLSHLVPRILSETDLYRLRLSSLDCVNITPELLRTWKESPRLCPHFHIPLQSGTDEMLRAMRRFYNLKTYIATIKRIREAIPEAALATDLIVGFPGETDELFERSYRVVEMLPFHQIHVFPFSARQGTVAAALPHQVSRAVKKERVHRIRELVERKRQGWFQQWIGREVEVIAEHAVRGQGTSDVGRRTSDERAPSSDVRSSDPPTFFWRGTTPHGLPVYLHAPRVRSNQLLPVRLTGISADGTAVVGIVV